MALTSATRCSSINPPPPGTFSVIGEIREIPYEVRTRRMRSSLYENIVQDWFFIVIGISFSAIFFTSAQIGTPRGLSEVNLSFPLTYILYIISYCFIFDISLLWKSSGERPPRAPFDLISMFWLIEKLFWCPPRFQVAKGRFYWNRGY